MVENIGMRNLEELCSQKPIEGFCFIIGSGPSLHFQDLGFLKDHTTITINAGFLRYPKAEFFLSDDQDSAGWDYFTEDLKNADTQVLLYEDKYRKFGDFKQCQKLFGDRLVGFQHRQGNYLTYIYEHDDPKKRVWAGRCSMISAVHVAYLMGFRKIVLLGADCVLHQGKRYFYEFPGQKKPRRLKPFVQKRFRRKIRGYETESDLMEINDGWNLVSLNTENHCQIYNGSHLSVIRWFPKIDLEQFSE